MLVYNSNDMKIDEINPVWLGKSAPPIVGSLMQQVNIDIEHILTDFHALQKRVEHVIVERVGGWLVPIRPDYFVSDLASAMKVPVLVLAQNRLGCLNHTVLTLLRIAERNL